MTTSASFSKLQVLAERAKRILGKHKGSHPAIQVYETTLPLLVEQFETAFNAVQAHRIQKSSQLRGGKATVDSLLFAVRVWLAAVKRDVPDFALDPDLDRLSPDKVLKYAESMLEVVRSPSGQGLPYAATLVESVTPLIGQARIDWESAQKALGELQELRRALRVQSSALDQELVAFRTALRIVIGPSHRDYQLLRVDPATAQDLASNKSDEDEDEDDEDDSDESEALIATALPLPPQPVVPSVAVNGSASNGRASTAPIV